MLAGRMSLPAAIELTKTHTRRFAKRQMTWFRSIERVPVHCHRRPVRSRRGGRADRRTSGLKRRTNRVSDGKLSTAGDRHAVFRAKFLDFAKAGRYQVRRARQFQNDGVSKKRAATTGVEMPGHQRADDISVAASIFLAVLNDTVQFIRAGHRIRQDFVPDDLAPDRSQGILNQAYQAKILVIPARDLGIVRVNGDARPMETTHHVLVPPARDFAGSVSSLPKRSRIALLGSSSTDATTTRRSIGESIVKWPWFGCRRNADLGQKQAKG